MLPFFTFVSQMCACKRYPRISLSFYTHTHISISVYEFPSPSLIQVRVSLETLFTKYFTVYFIRKRHSHRKPLCNYQNQKLILIRCYKLIHNLHSYLINCLIICFLVFPSPGFNPATHNCISCHVSLVVFNLEQFLCFSWWLLILIFMKSPSQLFCRMPVKLSFSDISSWFDSGYACLAEKTKELILCPPWDSISGCTWCSFVDF